MRGEDEDELVSNDIDARWRRPPGGRGGSAGPKSTGKREHQKNYGEKVVIGGKFKRIYNIPRDVYIMTASWRSSLNNGRVSIRSDNANENSTLKNGRVSIKSDNALLSLTQLQLYWCEA